MTRRTHVNGNTAARPRLQWTFTSGSLLLQGSLVPLRGAASDLVFKINAVIKDHRSSLHALFTAHAWVYSAHAKQMCPKDRGSGQLVRRPASKEIFTAELESVNTGDCQYREH